MGAATSSNASEAVSNVSSFVSNQTTADAEAVQDLRQTANFSNCDIILLDNMNVEYSATTMVKNNQILKGMQNASLQNAISQKILQEASSTVGTLGVGYADAHNSSKMLVNSSTDIRNAMETSAKSYSNADQVFNCDRSTIQAKNLNINFDSDQTFLTQQTLNNSQTAKVINDISQTATQKATSKVEGLAGLLIALALIIFAILYPIAKSASSPGVRMIIAVVIFFVIGGIILAMYLSKSAPFFNSPNIAKPYSSVGCDGSDGITEISNRTIHIKSSPFRYTYVLTGGDANMTDMVVAMHGGNNGGYNQEVADILDMQIQQIVTQANINISDIPNIPNILNSTIGNNTKYLIPETYINGKCTPSRLTSINTDNTDSSDCTGSIRMNDLTTANNKTDPAKILALVDKKWKDFCDGHPKEARYILSRLLNIDCSIYISEDEYVAVKNDKDEYEFGLASDSKYNQYAYKFNPDLPYNFYNEASTSSGSLNGLFGYCNNQDYKLQKTTQSYIFRIFIVLIILAVLAYLIFFHRQNKQDEVEK